MVKATPLSHIGSHTIERRHFLQAMRGLFTWAAKVKHVASDPTVGLKIELPQQTAITSGQRMNAQSLRRDGRAVFANEPPSTCCSIRACAAVTPFGLVGRTSRMAQRPSALKRPGRW
jgi:hypothetical protein